MSICQDVDRATSAQIALEKNLEQLEAKLAFMQKIHKEVMHLSTASLFHNRLMGLGFYDIRFMKLDVIFRCQ